MGDLRIEHRDINLTPVKSFGLSCRFPSAKEEYTGTVELKDQSSDRGQDIWRKYYFRCAYLPGAREVDKNDFWIDCPALDPKDYSHLHHQVAFLASNYISREYHQFSPN